MVCRTFTMNFPTTVFAMEDCLSNLPLLLFLFVTVTLLNVFLHDKLSLFIQRQKVSPATSMSVLGFIINRHRFLDWLTDILSAAPSNTFPIPYVPCGIRVVATANPANVEHILKTNFENYPKGEHMRSLFHDFLGRGIFNANGEQWRMQRKSASYEFSTKSLRKFLVETVQWEITNRLMVVLSQACEAETGIDLYDILKRFTFDNICRVAFGVDPSCLHRSLPASPLQQAFDDAIDISYGRFFYVLPDLTVRIKRMLNVGSERRLREAVALVGGFAMNVVRSRRSQISEDEERPVKEDLLSRFMAAVIKVEGDEQHKSDVFVKDMVVSIMLAGRDATSSALTWFFWVLSRHPRVEEVIHSEIVQVLDKRNAPLDEEEETVISFEELKGMEYLHAALCESMRLYPPVPVDSKIAAQDDTLPDGTRVRKGSFLVYSNYAMGRVESIWGQDFMEFRPERWFKDGRFEVENAYKFPVFNAGPRTCLGREMAFIQMKSIVATVLRHFILKVDEGFRPRYSLSMTLRMEGGLPVNVQRRKNALLP